MKKYFILSAISLFFLFTGCDDDESSPKPTTGKILISTTVPNADPTTGSSYLQAIEDFTKQSVDNSRAYQIPYGTTALFIDGEAYVMPGINNDFLQKYTVNDNNELVKTGGLPLPPNSTAYCVVKETDTKGYLSFMRRSEIWEINLQTMTPTDTIDISGYGVNDNNPNASIMVIRDQKLYVGLNQIDETSAFFLPYADRPFSDILIIDTPTNKVEKMITNSTSGISTSTRPVDPNTLFVDENNDIYVVCVGAWGFIPGHNSGILRIKDGETDFDSGYQFVVNGANVINDTTASDHLSMVKYMGNGKLYAVANFPAYSAGNPYLDRTMKPVVIDIYAETITKLPFKKRSNPFASISSYKDKVVFGMVTDTEQGFFSYDPATNSADTEPVITTIGYPSIFGTLED